MATSDTAIGGSGGLTPGPGPQVDLLPGVQVRLYLAVDVEEAELGGSEGLVAVWAPLDAVLASKDQASLTPYLEPLQAWLHR